MPAAEHLPEDWERALAIVAHPDDLEYGCAAAVARWMAQGKSVRYLVVSHGEAGIDGIDPAAARGVRDGEQVRSAAAVGVSAVEFLDHPDGSIEYGLRLRGDLVGAVRRHRPEVLLSLNPHLRTTGGGPNMADHRAVGTAVLDAARDAGNRWIFRSGSAQGPAPWAGVRLVCFAATPSPTHIVDVTEFVEQGVAALEAQHTYLSGIDRAFDPDAYLRGALSRAGERAGLAFAIDLQVWRI